MNDRAIEFKVNDILVTYNHYCGSRAKFYQVTNNTGKTIKVKAVESNYVDWSPLTQSGNVVPSNRLSERETLHRIDKFGRTKIGMLTAYLWSGKAEHYDCN